MTRLGEVITKRVLIAVFIVIAITATALRVVYFGDTRVSPDDTVWKVAIQVQFNANDAGASVGIARPKLNRFQKLISQRQLHPDLKLVTTGGRTPGYLYARAHRGGQSVSVAEFHVQLAATALPQFKRPASLDTRGRAVHLASDGEVDITLPALLKRNEDLRQGVQTRKELLQKIVQASRQPLKSRNSIGDNLEYVLAQNKATNLGRARLMVALSRINDIPARLATGFVLKDGAPTQPYHWVQIYDDKEQWQAYDPQKGYGPGVPKHYLTFNYNNSDVIRSTDGTVANSHYQISEDLDVMTSSLIEQNKQAFEIFDLRRMDHDTKLALIKLLILPLCVLFTAFLRHVVGLFPYGTFTAPLLSLAMVYAEVEVTLVVGAVVIGLALLGRSLLPKTLARAPRLSLIFTFVALAMVFSSSILTYFSLQTGGGIILIPTIILVAVVDRFYTYMDEAGAHAALVRLGVTVLIAFLCVPILQVEMLGAWLLSYPELHFITAAAVLVLSSYSGKKITDYPYLKLLGQNKVKKEKEKDAAEKKDDAVI